MLVPVPDIDKLANMPDAFNARQVYLVLDAVDMRVGVEGLSMMIERTLGRSPCDGSAYAFSNKPRNRIKLLQWDATGVWLAARRLHAGRFVWPRLRLVDSDQGSTAHAEVNADMHANIDTNKDTVKDTVKDTAQRQHEHVAVVDHSTWQWLVGGVDWQRVNAKVTDNARWRVS